MAINNGQQEHRCRMVLWCSESKRALVGGPRAWKKFCKSTMMEHVLRRLKVDDFSSFFLHGSLRHM